MQTARPAATTVVTRPTSSGPASTGYHAVSAMLLHPVAGLGQECDGGRTRVGGGRELRIGAGRAAEPRVVEEAVDPARPRRRVQVRLGVVAVARRRAVRRPATGGAVAHVDGGIEVLR